MKSTEEMARAVLGTAWDRYDLPEEGNLPHHEMVSAVVESVDLAAAIPDGKVEGRKADFTLQGADEKTYLPVDGFMDEEEFWNARDYLAYIRQFAWAQVEAPYALLLGVLVRACGEVGPWITLPAIVGSQVSINYYGVGVAGTGGGKSSVSGVVDDIKQWKTPEAGLSSGEGIVTSYLSTIKDDDGNYVPSWHHHSLYFEVDEASNLMAASDRHGSTLLGNLRTVWTKGGKISMNNKNRQEKLFIPKHSIRTALMVAGQPNALGPILIDEGKGTAERFVSQDLIDPRIPDEEWEKPEGELPDRLHQIPKATGLRGDESYKPEKVKRVDVTYDPRIVELIGATRRAEKQGKMVRPSVVSPKQFGKVVGHRNLTILKTAALFALLDGRMNVTFEDWGLAIHFLSESEISRKKAIDAFESQKQAENESKGQAIAHTELATEERKDSVRTGKTLDRVVEIIGETEGQEAIKSEILRRLSKLQKEVLDDALAAGLNTGKLKVEDRENQSGKGKIETASWYSLGPNAAK